MQTNQLSDEARKVLLAIFQDGAMTGQVHLTSFEDILGELDWKVGTESIERVRAILLELLSGGYSIKIGASSLMGSYLSSIEIEDNGNLKITVNIPENLAYTL